MFRWKALARGRFVVAALVMIASALAAMLQPLSAGALPCASGVNNSCATTTTPSIFQRTYAADSFTPSDEVASFSYYTALTGCIQHNLGQGGSPNITVPLGENGNPKTSEMFDDNNAYGYVFPSDTKTDCRDILSAALTMWGWSSTGQFLKDIGYAYQLDQGSNSSHYVGIGDETARVQKFQAAVQAQVYGTTPQLSDAAKYVQARDAFLLNGGACQASDLGTMPDLGGNTNYQKLVAQNATGNVAGAPTPFVSSSGSVQYTSIPIVDASGTKADHGYVYYYSTTDVITSIGGGGPSVPTVTTSLNRQGLYGYHVNPVSMTCSDLAKEMQSKAGNYVAWFTSHQGKKDAASAGICTQNPNAAGCPPAKSSCNIGGVGWLICPVLTAGAGLADSAYQFLSDNFLRTDPSLVNSDPKATAQVKDANGNTVTQPVGTGTFTAWGLMRSLANVAFIIVFLIVVVSQISNVGVSQYGVKKIMPRLVIAAVLVNASFLVCQLAVDLSNVAGYSLKDLLAGVAQQVAAAGGGTLASITDQSGNLAGITATVLAVGAAAWINVGALIVAVVGAIVALFTIFVLLIIRKALIVLLIVVAPLAFVAFLLPNTETYFKKWRQTLTTLLLLFPIIGVLDGACLLASAVLKQVAGQDTVMQIVAYIVLVVPLIAAIPLLRGSLEGIGKIGGAIQGFGQKARGAAEKRAQTGFDRSRLGQFKKYREGRRDLRRAQVQSGTYSGWNPLLKGRSALNRGFNQSRLSGRFGDQASATGAALEASEDAELMKSADARIASMSFTGADGVERPLSTQQLIQLAKGSDVTDTAGNIVAKKGQFDEHARRAAILRASSVADVTEAHQLLDSSTSMSKLERKTLAEGFRNGKVSGVAPWLTGKTLANIEQGGITAEEATMSAIEAGKLTAEALASGDDKSSTHLLNTLTDHDGDSAALLARKAALRASVKQEADKIYAAGSRLGERVTAASVKGVNVTTMRGW